MQGYVPKVRRPLLVSVLLSAAVALRFGAHAVSLGKAWPLPLGPDPDLWSRVAWTLNDDPASIPPLFPRLFALLAPGRGGAHAAVVINGGALVLSVFFAGFGASMLPQRPWSRVAAAVGAALLAGMLTPWPHLWWVGPEALTRAALAATALGAAGVARRMTGARWLALGAAVGLVFQVREHGIPVLAAALVVAPVVARGWARLWSLGALLLGVQATTWAVHGVRGPFWAPQGAPHGTLVKAFVATRDTEALAAGAAPPSLTGDEVLEQAVPTSLVDLVSQLVEVLSGPVGLSVGAAVAAAVVLGSTHRWRLGLLLLVPLAPLPAGLAVHVEPRHIEVLTAAAAVLVCGTAATSVRLPVVRLLVPPAFALLFGGLAFSDRQTRLGNTVRLLESVVRENPDKLALATVVRAQAEPGDLVFDNDELVALVAGLPRGWPQRWELEAPLEGPDPRYRLWWVSPTPPPSPWEAVGTSGGLGLYRLPTPPGAERRCWVGNPARMPWLHAHRFRQEPLTRPWSDCPGE